MTILSLHRQPITALYIGYEILIGVLTFPFYCLYYIPTSNRQRIEYSWSQSIFLNVVRRAVNVIGRGRISPKEADPTYRPNPKHLSHSTVVEFDSIPLSRFKGLLKDFGTNVGLQEMPIKGYLFEKEINKIKNKQDWKPFSVKPQPDEKIIMALHGGGYVMGAAHELFHSTTAPMLQKHIRRNIKVFSVEYRLAEKYPFPNGLFDVISAYAFLVEKAGYDPKQIIVEGDSAGGNLALGLCRYLKETQMLPLPSALLLVSPGVDRTFSHRSDPELSLQGKEASQLGDLLTPALQNWTSNAYSGYGKHPSDLFESPYISPASVRNLEKEEDFKGLPTTFMSMGEFESYRPEQVLLFEKIRACNSNLNLGRTGPETASDGMDSNNSNSQVDNQNNNNKDEMHDDSISISMENSPHESTSKTRLNPSSERNSIDLTSSNCNSKEDLLTKPTISTLSHHDRTVRRWDFLQIIKGAPHDSTVLPSSFFEPHTTEAKKEMGRWIDSLE